MWSSLPSNLRTVLGTALLLGIGVAVAAFTLSFFALREAAENPALKWGQGHAWLFPIGIDMALVFFEVLLLGASMVRIEEWREKEGELHRQLVQYPRVIPFLLVLLAGAGTLYFNATRVPEQVRPLALAVPAASILVTLGLAYLLKMLATASGEAVVHLAPPSREPAQIIPRRQIVDAELTRVDERSSSGPPSELNGKPSRAQALEGRYGAKRMKIEEHIAEHGTAEHPRKIARRLGVSERYVNDILREHRRS